MFPTMPPFRSPNPAGMYTKDLELAILRRLEEGPGPKDREELRITLKWMRELSK